MFIRLRTLLLSVGMLILLRVPAFPTQAPLSPDVADRASGYLEWMLDIRFNAEQQLRCRRMLEDIWSANKPGAADTILSMARVGDEVARVGQSAAAEQLRASKQKEFLSTLENSTTENSRWLLSVYKETLSGTTPRDETVPSLSVGSAVISAPFLGKWTDGHISSIQYKNFYTGISAPTNGSSFTYEFHPDGSYEFMGLMQNTSYNCTSSVFSHETGRYSLNGDAISMVPEKNPYRMTNNCAPSSNHESPGKLINRSYRYRVVTENGRRILEMQADGARSLSRFAESR